jgi:hypothetical protein
MILSLYRAPSGDINEFVRNPNAVLKYVHNPKFQFISCRDTLYTKHIQFATNCENSLSTAIYIFIDSARFSSSCLSPTADSL